MNAERMASGPDIYGKVAVLMGGDSAEREISLKSGHAVLGALRESGIDAYCFDPSLRPLTELVTDDFTRAFIALHGRGGEGGQIQGALEYFNIPYTGSGVLASALGMDKCRTKQLWSGCGLATPDFVLLNRDTDPAVVVDRLGLPIMVKPVHEGSSMGISKVKSVTELPEAMEMAMELDDAVLAEAWVEGDEYTISLLDDRVLPIIRLQTPRDFYDYTAKYEADTTEYIYPCGLSDGEEADVAALAEKAFAAVGATGWGRVDLILGHDCGPQLIEVNTIPGLTKHSLVPMSAKLIGINFNQLILEILDGSLVDAY